MFWRQFPLIVGEPTENEWQAPVAAFDRDGMTATLRLIGEYYDVRGHGDNRTNHHVFDCLYERDVALPATIQPGGRHHLMFTIPKGMPTTMLAATLMANSARATIN